MGIGDEFLAHYRREFDFFDHASRLVAQQLEQSSRASGIRAMVTSRAKNPERLLEKIKQREKDRHYGSLEDIYADIIDLGGVRVALYFPSERQELEKIIRSQFVLLGDPKQFPTSAAPTYSKRFSGYWASHYLVKLRDNSLTDAQRRFSDARVEVQVASVLMHAWAEVEHDLVYKPFQGRLSDDEYAILDELNGLVLAGEIALERLQRAAEVRVGRRGNRFSNHYDLAAFLFEATRFILQEAASDAALGRVRLLFDFLQRLELDRPEALNAYIAPLNSDVDQRSVSEQIVDQILSADASRYDIYATVKAAHEKVYPESDVAPKRSADFERAIGEFLFHWIRFERFVRELGKLLVPEVVDFTPTGKRLAQLQIFDDDLIFEVDTLRRLRNRLVHGTEIPELSYINEASKRIRALLEGVVHSGHNKVKEAIERADSMLSPSTLKELTE